MMKRTYALKSSFLTLVILVLLSGHQVSAQVGVNTLNPDPSSVLDINSDDKGLLIPRVSLSNLSSINPITGGSPESLLIYNINPATGKGFHYWSGSAWQSLNNQWKTSGNSGTNPNLNYIGTQDENDLVFKANDEEAMRIIASDGQLLIGKSISETTNDLLQVASDIEIGGGASNFTSTSENIKITSRTQQWSINVKNSPNAIDSNFYIGTSEGSTDAAILISPEGNVKIGNSGDVNPLSELHISKDQPNKATSMRLDNTYSTTNIPHTSYELWDGNTYLKGFFRHNNKYNILDVGHNQGNGIFNFYAGNGGSSANSSSIAMTLDANGDLNVYNDLKLSGNLEVTGTISKAGGTFKIDHPLDPANKYLYHSFVESPDMMNIYNGNITTNANGEAMVKMPDYFSALNIDFRYQLTTIGSFSKAMVAEEIQGNTFLIKSEEPFVKISWQVTGVRNDPYARNNRVTVEVDKEVHKKGTYLFPKANNTNLEK